VKPESACADDNNLPQTGLCSNLFTFTCAPTPADSRPSTSGTRQVKSSGHSGMSRLAMLGQGRAFHGHVSSEPNGHRQLNGPMPA
jgi:hypothetical protein